MTSFLIETEAGDLLAEVEGTRTEALEIAQAHANMIGARVAVIGEGTPTWVARTTVKFDR